MRCVIFGKQTIKGRKVLYTKQYLALRGYQETNKDYNFIYVINSVAQSTHSYSRRLRALGHE